MELQIQDLVTSIRKEGLEASQIEAEAIISDAQRKADSIVSAAKAEAEATKAAAEKEVQIMQERVRISAQQAKRDATLAFKAEIKKEFERILANDVQEVLKGDALATLIKAALKSENAEDYVAETASVTEALKAELSLEIKNGLEIRPGDHIKTGFRLAAKDHSGYFDCTDEEITQMLLPYLRNLDL